VRRGKVLTRTEEHTLNFARLSREDLSVIGKQIEEFGEKDGAKTLNLDLWTDQRARENCIYTIHQWNDMDVMKPGFETPKFGPLGEMLLQFNKFMIPAYDRCLLPTVQRLAAGDYAIISRILAMICMGGLRDLLNRAADGREVPTAEQFILQGIAEEDIFPFVGSLFKDMSDAFSSDDVLDHVGDNLVSFFTPPSVRLVANAIRGGNGLTKLLIGDERPTRREARALKQSIWLNNHYLFRGILYRWKEALYEPRR
jgi:hypothetical protein